MFSKTVILALLDDFFGKFDQLTEHSTYLKKAVADIKENPGVKEFTKEQEISFDNDLQGVICETATLAYFIGLQDGSDMVNLFSSSGLSQKMIDALS